MIHVVNATNQGEYLNEMEQVWRLRHRVFVEGKGWSELAKPDGREIDQFDTPSAIHFLLMRGREVVAYSRLLPTAGPHLLSDVFPKLCQEPLPRDHATYEWTRQAVSPEYRVRGKAPPLTYDLVAGIVEWGLSNGVSRITAQIPMSYLLRMLQLHFRARPLGLPVEIAGESIIAVAAEFDGATLARVNQIRGDSRSILASVPAYLVA